MLDDAKKHCDYLIVALQTDPTNGRPNKNKPIQSIVERWIQVTALRSVDAVVPYDDEDDLMVLLQHIRPDMRILGDDYIDQPFTGKQWCIDNDVKIVYSDRAHNYSSTSLRNKVHQAEQAKRPK